MTKRDPQRSGPAPWPAQAEALLAAATDLLAPGVDPGDFSDAQLNARIAAARAVHLRAFNLALLRFSEESAAKIHARLAAETAHQAAERN